MKPMRSLLVVFLVACGGLQTTETACEEGFTKADDGACYPTAPEDGGGGIDNEGDGEDGPDDDFDGAPPRDTADPGDPADAGSPDGGAPEGGPEGGDFEGGPEGGDFDGGPEGGDFDGGPEGGDFDGGPEGGDFDGGPEGGDFDGGPEGGDPGGGGGDPGGGGGGPGPGSCTSDDECSDGKICVAIAADFSLCAIECEDDTECPAEEPSCTETSDGEKMICGPEGTPG